MACSAWPSAGTAWTGGWPATPSAGLGRQRGVADCGTAACALHAALYLSAGLMLGTGLLTFLALRSRPLDR
jgi:hypothetical protein